MIKGNLSLISVPGLLQLLANEPAKGFRVTIEAKEANSQIAQLYVIDGELFDSHFGILEGVDALAEIISWTNGEFVIEELKNLDDHKRKGQAQCNLRELGSFQDQCCFLRRVNIGLSSEIIPSSNFGQPEWQEALYVQPLGKFDYTVLGWITDGRTMRQAISELNIDLKTAIGILYRLVLTGSVEAVKPDIASDKEVDIKALVAKRMEAIASKKVGMGSGATIVSNKGSSSDTASKAVSGSKSTSSINDTKEALERQASWDMPSEKDTDTQELPTVGNDIGDELATSLLDSPLTRMIQDEVDKEEKSKKKEIGMKESPAKVIIEAAPFDLKRTDPLPIVSIDIERLLNTNFKLTAKGAEQLEDASDHDMVIEVLREVKLGKSLLLVLTDSNRSDASIMATYRYCLENDFINHHDPVVQLTIDLVLDRLDLIQYLLQRRRITGDQLKELNTISERQGISIIKLLTGAGAVLPADLERLKQEKERFSPK